MRQYAIRRLLIAIPVLVMISLAVFSLVRILPGDAIVALVGDAGFLTQENADRIRAELGLDKPFVTQYFVWVGGIFQGDLGNSLVEGRSVAAKLQQAIPVTLQLAIMAMLIAILIAIPIGVLSAIRQDTIGDYIGRMISITGLSAPDFMVATFILVFAGVFLRWAPPATFTPFFDNPAQNLKGMIIPAAILGFRFSSTSMRMIRSAMLEVLREDYVRTAWAKGLHERRIIARHVIKNAFIPVVTILGTEFSYLLGGSVIIETIFGLPGVGLMALNSISNRDYPVVQATVLFIATVMVVMNLLVDLSYGWFDPRIRYGGAA